MEQADNQLSYGVDPEILFRIVPRDVPCCSCSAGDCLGQTSTYDGNSSTHYDLVSLRLSTQGFFTYRKQFPAFNITELITSPGYFQTILTSWLAQSISEDANLFQVALRLDCAPQRSVSASFSRLTAFPILHAAHHRSRQPYDWHQLVSTPWSSSCLSNACHPCVRAEPLCVLPQPRIMGRR